MDSIRLPAETTIDQVHPPLPEKKDRPEKIQTISTIEDLSKRLTRLAHLSILNSQALTHPLNLDTSSIQQCLDKLESLLDPRSHLTREITICRPDPGTHGKGQRKSDKPKQFIPISRAHSRSRSLEVTPKQKAPLPSGLAVVHDEVRTLADEFRKRRDETLHIYKIYDDERKRLEHNVAKLEAEIVELRADMQEDTAGREALQGTVRGFEAWIGGWLAEYDLVAHAKTQGRGWWKKRPSDKPGDFDVDALFEGITAWMRGWTDVEEEFRNRDNARKLRRRVYVT
ncbi:hypothetical protein BJY04DRAFT_151171 [Aspergillus karnatakaensis]|uniref:uncharacterized protein n=1 Tax=Aspergillus karnatakaensis TaxID=1810916 RepID=UPI003CCD4859